MQSHKQAITHSRGVQTDPKVPKGKEYAQTGGKGAPGRTPLHSLKNSAAPSEASFLLSTESRSRLSSRSGERQRKFRKRTSSAAADMAVDPGQKQLSPRHSQLNSPPHPRTRWRSRSLGDLTPAWLQDICHPAQAWLSLKKPTLRGKCWVEEK